MYIYIYIKCRTSHSDESTEGASFSATTERNQKKTI